MANGIRMNAQFAADGSDLPVFGVKQAANFDVSFWADHGSGSTEASWKSRERVHPTAATAADDATWQSAVAQCEPGLGLGRGRIRYCGVGDLISRCCRRSESKGNLDPSRFRARGIGTHAGGHDDPDVLRG